MVVKGKEVLGIINTRDIKKPAAVDISEKHCDIVSDIKTSCPSTPLRWKPGDFPGR